MPLADGQSDKIPSQYMIRNHGWRTTVVTVVPGTCALSGFAQIQFRKIITIAQLIMMAM